MLKKKIKDKNKSDNISFYTFKILNAQFSKENFYKGILKTYHA
jgi:hypothetical protein